MKLFIKSTFFVTSILCTAVTYANTQTVTTQTELQKAQETLTADTPINKIYKYQSFFKDTNNIPQLQVASPSTLYMWQNISRIFRTEMVLRDGEISPLPAHINPAVGALTFELKDEGKTTVNEYFNKHPMDAMLVVHHGDIIYEQYKTMRSFDKHNWFSIGKVIPGTTIALLEDEGKIDVKKSVSTYLPELKGSAWDSVPVIDVLNMATGLNATEHEEPGDDARINPARGWFQWATAMGIFPNHHKKHESPFDVLRRMKRVKPGNTVFEYNSINTWILELITERITGKPLNEAFGEDVWRKIGAQADGFIGITPDGYSMAWGFMSSTLRDLARFGMIYTPSWNKVSKEKIISDAILNKIQHGGNPAIFGKGYVGREMHGSLYDTDLTNSYQWDVVFADGDFFKLGTGGQGLYVSPSRDLVVAWFSTGENNAQVMARAIATAKMSS